MKRSKIFNWIVALLLFFSVERFCRWQTDGFRLTKASTRHCYPLSFPSSTPPPLASLNQSFHFLGSGVQCYAFIGEDGETVLKLFKHHHAGPSNSWLDKLPFSAPIIKRREKRMSHLLKSAYIAHTLLPKETAVFYSHLEKSKDLLGKLCIIDKLGISYQIDLDQTEFILQKKVTPTREHLSLLLKEKQYGEAALAIQNLLCLIKGRSMKGIKNKDGRILDNSGFLGTQGVELDIGSYVMRSNSFSPNPHEKGVKKALNHILDWVEKNHPSAHPHLLPYFVEEDS